MRIELFLFFPRKCDFKACHEIDTAFVALHGCGHSFHPQCIKDGSCSICSELLQTAISNLVKIANDAIFRKGVDNDTPKQSKQAKTSTDQDDPIQDDLLTDNTLEERNYDSTIQMMNESIVGWLKSAEPRD